MGFKYMSTYLSAAAAATVAALDGIDCLSAVAWADPRVDLFGLVGGGQVWHKFYTGWDWQPFNGFEHLPLPAKTSCPAVSSWGEGRLDLVFLSDSDDTVSHIYYESGAWGTDDLGNEDIVALGSTSWGDNRLDIVGITRDYSYVHKAWTGDAWFPSEDTWEDFGGSFFSDPSIVSWAAGRIDIVGLSADDGSIKHMYYHDGWSKWEDLGGGPFVGNPIATSWGPDRLDIWAIDSEGELNHLYWDGSRWSDWEQLGGAFTDTPKVAHWNVSKIDIVGKGQDDGKFYQKSYDGSKWNPSGKDWNKMGGPFASEPAILAKHKANFLYVFGVDEDDELRMQIWTGYDWQPGFNQTWSLGNVSQDATAVKMTYAPAQNVLGSLEL